ncbi:MAG: THUMP domain-containing protein [Candidatus Woesearchaeota archaeon]
MVVNSIFCIIRYGELALKGKNRLFFEKSLVKSLKTCLKLNKLGFVAVIRVSGRFLIDLGCFNSNNCEITEQIKKYYVLANVFGVNSISFGYGFSMDELEKGVELMLKDRDFNTFRISTNKVGFKNKDKSSMDIDRKLGSYVVEKYGKKVSLKEFDININIELIDDYAYIFLDKIKGIGGLPYGVEGKCLAFIRNKNDLLAALLMMKRGCAAVCVIAGDVNIITNSEINQLFIKYGVKPHIIKCIGEIKDTGFIKGGINEIARKEMCNSVVSGQTLDDFEKFSELVEFRPLIGMAKKELYGLIKKLL